MSISLESALIEKLGELTKSQRSIHMLSLWFINQRVHYKKIVQVWNSELVKAQSKRKINFIYLANHVIQVSSKKGSEYRKEFGLYLPKAIHIIGKWDPSRESLKRTIKIWSKRGVYTKSEIQKFRKALEYKEPVIDKMRSLSNEAKNNRDPRIRPVDPPEDPEILKILEQLQNSPVEENPKPLNTSYLSAEVIEADLIIKMCLEHAAKLSNTLQSAIQHSNNYNARILEEIEGRKKLGLMPQHFTIARDQSLAEVKKVLEEYQSKVQFAYSVRLLMRSQLQNNPRKS